MCPKSSSLTLAKLPGSGLEGDAEEDQGKSRTGTQVFAGKGMGLGNLPILGGSAGAQVEIHPQVGAFWG